MSDINVTPFVDVLLVLLIIFMVTAPIVHHVIQVDLPKDSYNQDKAQVLQEPLKIQISQKGEIYIGQDRIGSLDNQEGYALFQKKLRSWASLQKEPSVDIEADQNALYRSIVPVVARLKEMNVGINLVIEPQPKSKTNL